MEIILWILAGVAALIMGKCVYDRITHNNRMKAIMDEVDTGLSELIRDLTEAKEIITDEIKKPDTTVKVDTQVNTGAITEQVVPTTTQKTKVVKSKTKNTVKPVPKKASKTKVKKA